jgi:hypothetical protein
MAETSVAEASPPRRGRRAGASAEVLTRRERRAAEEAAAALAEEAVAALAAGAPAPGPVELPALPAEEVIPDETLWPIRDKASWGRPLEDQELSQIDVEAVLTSPPVGARRNSRAAKAPKPPKASKAQRVTRGLASGNLYRHVPVVLHVLLVLFVLGACVLFAMSLAAGPTPGAASQVTAELQLDRMSNVTPAPPAETAAPAPEVPASTPAAKAQTAGSPMEIDPLLIGAALGGLGLSASAVLALLVIRLTRGRRV